jgi:hypothetical protein
VPIDKSKVDAFLKRMDSSISFQKIPKDGDKPPDDIYKLKLISISFYYKPGQDSVTASPAFNALFEYEIVEGDYELYNACIFCPKLFTHINGKWVGDKPNIRAFGASIKQLGANVNSFAEITEEVRESLLGTRIVGKLITNKNNFQSLVIQEVLGHRRTREAKPEVNVEDARQEPESEDPAWEDDIPF